MRKESVFAKFDTLMPRSAGKERDSESGSDYFGARYYASNTGRFLSPDPSGLAFADPTNPQSLNLYSYVYDNPLVNVDPTGLDPCGYDLGDGTATLANVVDGGAVVCQDNGFYVTTTQQLNAAGFDLNGDLGVYGAVATSIRLFHSSGDPDFSASVSGIGGGCSMSDSRCQLEYETWYNASIGYYSNQRKALAPSSGPSYTHADVCAASALLNRGAGTALDILGAIPVLGSWSKGAQAAVSGVQLAGGLASAGMAAFGGTLIDGGSSGAGLGLAGAAGSLPEYTAKFFGSTVSVVPLVGNLLSAGMAVNDIWGKDGMVNYYNDCSAGKN